MWTESQRLSHPRRTLLCLLCSLKEEEVVYVLKENNKDFHCILLLVTGVPERFLINFVIEAIKNTGVICSSHMRHLMF